MPIPRRLMNRAALLKAKKKKNELTVEIVSPQQLEEPESLSMSEELIEVSTEAPTEIEAEQSSDT